MRIARITSLLGLILCVVVAQSQSPKQKVTLSGQLSRSMAIGGESTGWTLQLDSETSVENKPVHSIEIQFKNAKKLEQLNNKHVTAVGVITHRTGVETGTQPVLAVSSLRETKPVPAKNSDDALKH